ncbi:MAG: OadG family protein [Bacteroides sp.]|nr:OadG family protein [Bacillota bacterium]MCM1393639.1 OadG family protein [[Eubacterium] siraeum]MCM1456098.1 OadG family protein [Bacteroides sp.]
MNFMLLSAVLDKDEHIKVVDALLLAVIGIAIVFVVLIVLMLVVTCLGKAFDGSEKLKAEHPEWGEKINAFKSKLMFWKKGDKNANVGASGDSQQSKSNEVAEVAVGTCGELKLINTDERDAAMIMAIVADSTGTPLNELRFKSIKKAEDNE